MKNFSLTGYENHNINEHLFEIVNDSVKKDLKIEIYSNWTRIFIELPCKEAEV